MYIFRVGIGVGEDGGSGGLCQGIRGDRMGNSRAGNS